MSDVNDRAVEDEPLLRIAARRAVRRIREDAGTPQFGRLLLLQSLGAAGDALIALALAGSLFFSVPETTARGRVVLYLFLTVTPFAVVAPIMTRVLDRHRAGLRWAAAVGAAGRAACAWGLSTQLDSFYLFPLAFGALVLSRSASVVKGALLPQIVPEGRTLVAANSTVSKMSAITGALAVAPGLALIKYPGVRTELMFAALVYMVGVLPALGLPGARGQRRLEEQLGARKATRSLAMRQAILGAAGMRLLVGFLVMHLAFAFRRDDAVSEALNLGLLLGAAQVGNFVGVLSAPRLRRRLREEGILVTMLVFAGLAGIAVGNWFSLAAAGGLVVAFAIAAGASKLAFDSIVQRDTPEGARGWAFARFEATMQLAWVVGAVVPAALDIPGGPGVLGAGVLANLLAMMLIVGRRRARRAREFSTIGNV